MISERIYPAISSPNENLNMVIPILMQFCSLVSYWSVASRIKPHVIQPNVTLLMLSNYFGQYIAGYYCMIYWLKFFTLSNQTSCYKSKCIRMCVCGISWSYSIFDPYIESTKFNCTCLGFVFFLFFVWFDSLRHINNLSVIQGRVFLGYPSTKLG